jgi:hypothetical protein
MELNALREALHKQPFRPFALRLADGRELFIPHPDFVAVSKRQVIVVHPETESWSVLEPLLIVSLEFLGGSPPIGNQQAPA